MKFGLCYDLRNPTHLAGPRSMADLYAATLEQIEEVERLGYDDVWFSEHHFVPDGYLPSPLVLAAATAARTRRVTIGTCVLLTPFYNPIRLAEDGAVIDNLSQGRFALGPGLGFRPEEFTGYGLDRQRRSSITEEAIEIVIRCWTEEEFSYHGKHFHFENVRCTPKPVQKPRPPIWFGATKPAAIRRAARLGDGLIGPAPWVGAAYVEALREYGKDANRPRIASMFPWRFTSNDPERDWKILRPFALYQLREYAAWNIAAGEATLGEPPVDYADLEKRGIYLVGTPEQIVADIRKSWEEAPFERLWNMAVWPGADIEMATRSIELFAKEVIPKLRDLGE